MSAPPSTSVATAGSPSRGRKNKDTEAWVRSVMESAITSKRHTPSKTHNQEVKVGRRLASLYGSNTSSGIVKHRSKKSVRRKSPATSSSPSALALARAADKRLDVTFLAEPSTGGPANPAVLVDPKSSPPMRHRKIPLAEEDDVKSRVSAAPRWKRDKVESSGLQGWYIGSTSASGQPSPSFSSRVPRYGLEGTLRMAQRERPAMFSPVGHLKTVPDCLHRIPTSNVWAPPLFGSPGSWPKDAGKVISFKEARSGQDVVTARNLRSVQHEEREASLLYRSVSMERTIKSRAATQRLGTTSDGTSILNKTGRGARTAISTKRRNGAASTSKKAGRMKCVIVISRRLFVVEVAIVGRSVGCVCVCFLLLFVC
jgi:hypothetical protein